MAKAYLTANPPYVVVVKGDTLSEIAETYGKHISGTGIYGNNGKLATLTKINDISDANRIVVGQKIVLSGSSTAKKNTTSKPIIKAFGLQSNTDSTIYATWTWSKTNVENYKIIWQYDTGDGVWFNGNGDDGATTTSKQCTYSIPDNANKVRFKVRPVSKKRKVNGKETAYWTASWSDIKTYEVKNNPPVAPSFSDSNVSIDGKNKITIELTNLDTSVDGLNASTLQFQIYRNSTKLVHTGKADINKTTGYCTYSWTAPAGYNYSVRCRSVRGGLYSDWTDFTNEIGGIPPAPARIIDCYPINDTSIYLTWAGVNSAITYTVQYLELTDAVAGTTLPSGKTYFDIFENDQNVVKTMEVVPLAAGGSPKTNATVSGLNTGSKYYFRVRANGKDTGMFSAWTKTAIATLGTTPNPPTTWSSSNKVMVGDKLTLYWMHNSEDGSNPSKAKILFDITTSDGTYTYIHNVDYDGSGSVNVEDSSGHKVEFEEDENGNFISNAVNAFKGLFTTSTSVITPTPETGSSEDKNSISQYEIQTTNFAEGATIRWKVQTKGASDSFSDWSVEREFSILDYPELDVSFMGNIGVSDNEEIDYIFYSLPIDVKIEVKSSLQTPIGYSISIYSDSRYEGIDDVGNVKIVNANESVFTKYYDTNANPLDLTGDNAISAGDIDLENNVVYTFVCSVAMDSGLSIEYSDKFRVLWSDEQYEPNAEISIDKTNLTASIRPFCEDENGDLIENVLLSVYRREFDGRFVELIKDVKNTSATFVTDPHPALDYARYRIVAKSESTGSVSYYDIPGYPVNEKAAIIQWDEDWSNFNIIGDNWTEEDIATEQSDPVWTGSTLRLPYNIDVSDSNSCDVELVKYIGRRNPVSYYGTHVGQTQSWSMAVPKTDKETLYALRRLSVWMGDVYVREPSGSGYWASISVSFNQNHCEVTIPVSINITRVEGGV